MKASALFFRRPLVLAASIVLAAAGLVAGCSDYTTYGDDVGRNVVYGASYSGSGVYTGWGYAGNPYYGPGYGYGGGTIIVTPPPPSGPRPTPLPAHVR
jgi:hypothetical protein